MILYPVIWSDKLTDSTANLYYRASGEVRFKDNGVEISRGSVSFDTYFNIFSSKSFCEHTVLRTAGIDVHCTGSGSVSLYGINENGDKFELSTKQFYGEQTIRLDFDMLSAEFIFPVIQTDEKCLVTGAVYTTDAVVQKNVSAAIVICTYRREKYVYSNMERLLSWGLEIPVILVDNAGTIDSSEISYPYCTVYKNKNYGGSGGFSRGMIETVRNGNYTHIILMDDDISFERTAIEKSLAFLNFWKLEYSTCAIAGGMLQREKPYYQYEASALWKNGSLQHLKNGLDLRSVKQLFVNENNDVPNYGAWWFLCMPVRVIKEHGLPFPFFIKTDDIEYGLRTLNDIVVLNGVGVWHDSFEGKFRYHLEYYIKRNELVCDAIHSSKPMTLAINKLVRSIAKCLVGYNYRCLSFIEMAFTDFLKGPDFFLKTDEEQLNSRLMAMNEKQMPISASDIEKSESTMGAEKKKIKELLSLNGYLIPSIFLKKRVGIVDWSLGHPQNYYGYKTVIEYDSQSKCGVIRTMKRSQLFRGVWLLIKTLLALLIKYPGVRKQYQRRIGELTSLEFWCSHLDIDKI